MALTPFRWIAIAVAAALVTVAMLFQQPRPYELTDEQRRAELVELTASQHWLRTNAFARQYRVVQISDSLRAASPRGSAAPVRTSYAANVDPVVRAALDSAAAVGRAKVGASPSIGVDIVAFRDSGTIAGARPWNSAASPLYILPARAGDRCIVALPIGKEYSPPALARSLSSDAARDQMLGPCAYYAVFGLPGARVHDWMRLRGSLFALGGSWTRTTSTMVSAASLDSYYSPAPYYPNPPGQLTHYSNAGVRCMLGELEVCESLVNDVNLRSRQTTTGNATRFNYPLGPIGRYEGGEFGGRETELLADMVRALGRERFQRFWSSAEPVPAAFRQASGMQLGEWISSWAGERVDPVEHGPRIRAASLFSGLGIIAVCLLWATFMARRREFV